MADTDGLLVRRLDEVETRLAFQEQALAEMSDALAEARAQLAAQSERLQRALADLKHSAADGIYADPADEPPPPHY